MRKVHIIVLTVTMFLCIAAMAYEGWNITHDYFRPILADTFGFIADFQFFYEGAQRYLNDSQLIYEGNTHDGFLLIASDSRIDYGYPPPAVLLFVPFAWMPISSAYIAFMCFSMVLTSLCLILFWRICSSQGVLVQFALPWIISGIFIFASGMTYATYIFGQVNAVVLMLCLLYVACITRESYICAGILLGIGFWLKFYPLFLLVLAPLEKRPFRLLCLAGLSIILIPVVFHRILPLELYRHYFMDIYPGLADQTASHVYNQSIIGWMTRLWGTDLLLFNWGPFIISKFVRWCNWVGMAVIFGGIFLGYYFKRERKFDCYCCMLAATPMVVTYGWGGTYMLALPLILLVYIRLSSHSWQGALIGACMLVVYLIPAYRPFLGWNDSVGMIIKHLYYNRYLYATVSLLIGNLYYLSVPWRTYTVTAASC